MGPVKNIYLMGIGGTAMGSLACLLKAGGHRVVGSDQNLYSPMKEQLEAENITVFTPYAKENLTQTPDLIVVGNVISKSNPEAQHMLEQKMPFTTLPSALRQFVYPQAKPLVVTGTHGKTTTSSMLAASLNQLKLPHGFMIGGVALNSGKSFKLPPSTTEAFFVIEGDEYDTAFFEKTPKFLHYDPLSIIITSIEFDHADIYSNLASIKNEFIKLIEKIPENGHVVACTDDPNVQDVLSASKCSATITTYGKNSSDFKLTDFSEDSQGIRYSLNHANQIFEIKLNASGEHNALNSAAVFALLSAHNVNPSHIASALSAYQGVKRRMEVKGSIDDNIVIDDFAHHPTAVKTTLKGAKQKYPDHTLWALFEPRSATSCQSIFQDDYAHSFEFADKILLAPVGRKKTSSSLDVNLLAKTLNASGKQTQACENIDEMIRIVLENRTGKNVFLCMSNGAFDDIHNRLLTALNGDMNDKTI